MTRPAQGYLHSNLARRRTLLYGLLFSLSAALSFSFPAPSTVPEYGFEVVHVYPHDKTAFTEGLFYLDGFLYEGTGLPGKSSIRKVELQTGKVLQKHELSDLYFGEGIVSWKKSLIELT